MKTKRLGQSQKTNQQPESDETRKTRRKVNDLTRRVCDLEYRLNGLVNYSEYIAENVESIVNYWDFLSARISQEQRVNDSNGEKNSSNESVPNFAEFYHNKK